MTSARRHDNFACQLLGFDEADTPAMCSTCHEHVTTQQSGMRRDVAVLGGVDVVAATSAVYGAQHVLTTQLYHVRTTDVSPRPQLAASRSS